MARESVDGALQHGIATFTVHGTFAGVIRLNRAKAKNALSNAMVARLKAIVDHLYDLKDIRVVFMEHDGSVFCAGGDVKELAGSTEDAARGTAEFAQLLRRVNELPQLLIALCSGPAYGGGIGLLSCCDIVVATPACSFALSEVKLGMIAATIAPFVVAKMGLSQSRRYFQTGEAIDVNTARKCGLIHEIVAEERDLHEWRDNMIKQMANCAPDAVRKSKALVRQVFAQVIDDELTHYTAEKLAEVRGSPEVLEGVTAMMEKRKPAWAKL